VRRLFYVALGATAGVLIVRRVTAAANRWTPEGIAAQAGGAGDRVAAWWADVQEFAAQREVELRDALGLEDVGYGETGFDDRDEGAAR
jgi:hypothetical protein